MAHMQRQITTKKQWIEADTAVGTFNLPVDDLGTLGLDKLNEDQDELPESIKTALLPYLECYKPDQIYSAKIITGYGARLSAPGYSDCTDWDVAATYTRAQCLLDEIYPEDED